MTIRRAARALEQVEGIELLEGQALAQYTTFRIGGPVDLLVTAHTYAALVHALRILAAEEVSWVVLGRGSNVLASDAGYRGCVIRLGREFTRIKVDATLITAGAAVQLGKLVNLSLSKELAGLECCTGIPGTVGGAVTMNAGSRHNWVGAVVRDVVTYLPGTGMRRHQGSDIEWGYRWSSLPGNEIILEATFELRPSARRTIAAEMNSQQIHRKTSQPLGAYCCGSVFMNPDDRSAGELIESCGLKGTRVGGACISQKHANFVINEGTATAADVLELIILMRDSVLDRFGVSLIPEVRLLGFTDRQQS